MAGVKKRKRRDRRTTTTYEIASHILGGCFAVMCRCVDSFSISLDGMVCKHCFAVM